MMNERRAESRDLVLRAARMGFMALMILSVVAFSIYQESYAQDHRQTFVPFHVAAAEHGKPIKVVLVGEKADDLRDLIMQWNIEFQRSFPEKSLFDEVYALMPGERWESYIDYGVFFIKYDRTVSEVDAEEFFASAPEEVIYKIGKDPSNYSALRVVDAFGVSEEDSLSCASAVVTLNKNIVSSFIYLNPKNIWNDAVDSRYCLHTIAFRRLNIFDKVNGSFSEKYIVASSDSREFLDMFDKRHWTIIREIISNN